MICHIEILFENYTRICSCLIFDYVLFRNIICGYYDEIDFIAQRQLLTLSCYASFLVDAIRNGIDILVGTPGRIKDHIQNHKLDLTKLKHVVLDEVDQMLDMGFAEQVEEILASSYNKGKINL